MRSIELRTLNSLSLLHSCAFQLRSLYTSAAMSDSDFSDLVDQQGIISQMISGETKWNAG